MNSETEALESPVFDDFQLVSPPLAKSTVKHLASISSAVMPGQGKSGSDCGDPVACYCNHCHTSFWASRSCMLRTCPNCYEKWAAKEAKSSSTILWMGVHEQFRRFGTNARLLHCVVSFKLPLDDPAGEDLAELRHRAGQVCRKHGLVGTMQVLHPSRHYDGEGFHPESEDDNLHHFHVIGVATGDVLPGSSEEYRQGIIFKVVPDAKYHDFRGFRRLRDLRACIRYLLTHCGIIEGRHSVTYTGCFGYNKKSGLDRDALKEKYPEAFADLNKRGRRCPECGSDDVETCDQRDDTVFNYALIQAHPYPEGPPPDRGD